MSDTAMKMSGIDGSVIPEDAAKAIETAARAAHEANRVWCASHGDYSQQPWAESPEWQRSSAILGAIGVYGGNTPRESHECWLAEKKRNGWTYGPVKDAAKKEHPCFVPYDALPPEQQAKDHIFVSTVTSFLTAAGFPPRKQ